MSVILQHSDAHRILISKRCMEETIKLGEIAFKCSLLPIFSRVNWRNPKTQRKIELWWFACL